MLIPSVPPEENNAGVSETRVPESVAASPIPPEAIPTLDQNGAFENVPDPDVPRRSRAAYVYAVPSLILGISALPVAVGVSANLLIGLLLAGLGALLGIFALLVSLTRRGSGFGLATISLAVCGSTLYSTLMLGGGPRGLAKSFEDWLKVVLRISDPNPDYVFLAKAYLHRTLDDPEDFEIVDWSEPQEHHVNEKHEPRAWEVMPAGTEDAFGWMSNGLEYHAYPKGKSVAIDIGVRHKGPFGPKVVRTYRFVFQDGRVVDCGDVGRPLTKNNR